MTVVNEKDLATRFLHDIKAPISNKMLKAVASWMRQESGSHIVRNNPWNLTSFKGMTGFQRYDGAFAVFDNLTDGIQSTATGLMEFPPTDFRGYAQIVAAARKGDALYFMQCLAQSHWDAARYGTATGGPNHILNVYNHFGSFRTVSVSPGPLGDGFPIHDTPHPPTNNPPPPPAHHGKTYTVQVGDTLWSIAAKELGNGAFWPEIWDANKTDIPNPNLIHVGQVLDMPGAPSVATSPNQYIVKPGDTLSAIAEHFYHNAARWPDIYRANRTLIGGDPNLIHPGQVLTVPGV